MDALSCWAVDGHCVGSIFKGRFTFLGRTFEGNLEIIAHEPHQSYTTRLTEGPFPLEAHYTLESANGSTRVTLVIQGDQDISLPAKAQLALLYVHFNPAELRRRIEQKTAQLWKISR